nr:retrovirus-related Pol polyprotein from transposon TNT 1-94 [Tanacetum cinerariifolium]
ENGVVLDEEQLLFIASGQDNVVDEDVDETSVRDLELNVDNMFQDDECDAFDFDVDEASTAQTQFMANLSSADPVYDEASLSYDSEILSEIHDHDNYQDAVCKHHEYVKDNTEPVVQNNVSSVSNDAYMMIINEMHEQTAQCVYVKVQTKVVDASLTDELASYKEHVKLELSGDLHSIDSIDPRTDILVQRCPQDKSQSSQRADQSHKTNQSFDGVSFQYTYNACPQEHFEGIQKAFTKEIKEIFKELEAEVDQNAVNKKCDEIERKNILIENDNLIVDSLSKEVFYIATNYELT